MPKSWSAAWLIRHCERSEAIQSGWGGPLDCRVASILAMTGVNHSDAQGERCFNVNRTPSRGR
jgi:hypothetical protein